MLFENYKYEMGQQRVCYTIHNFKHQGIGGTDVLWATGLNNEAYYFQYDRLRDNFNPFALNFMKGGIVYSNYVTTVSPHHAWEVRFTPIGYGLGHTLHLYEDKFRGVLNGIDYDVWTTPGTIQVRTIWKFTTISVTNEASSNFRLMTDCSTVGRGA